MSRHSPHPEGSGANLPSTGTGEITSLPSTLQRREVSRWVTYVRSNPLQSKFPPNPDFLNDKTYSKHRYRSPIPIAPYTASTSNTNGTHVPESVKPLPWTYDQRHPQAIVSTTRQEEASPIAHTDRVEQRPVQSLHPSSHDSPPPALRDDFTATRPANNDAESLEVIEYEPVSKPTVIKRNTYITKNSYQLCVLDEVFAREKYPTTEEKSAIAKELDLPLRAVHQWFHTRRRRSGEAESRGRYVL